MNRFIHVCGAALLGVFLAASPIAVAAHAESEVLESDAPDLPVGTKIADDERVVIPDDAKVRVLIVSSGTTKTLKGPYEGTVEEYKEDRSWWERITGHGKDDDAPIGATRGIKPE